MKLCQAQGFFAPMGDKLIGLQLCLPYTALYGWHYIPSIIMTSTCNQPVFYYSWSILYDVGPA